MATLQQTVDRWTQSSGVAGTRYTEGVQGTTVDVVGRAIANQAALVSNFNQAVSSGLWARKLQDVGTAGWKSATIAKQGNYTTGFTAGAPKFQQSMSKWLPLIQGAAQQVKNTPATSFQARLQRAADFATILHNAKMQGV